MNYIFYHANCNDGFGAAWSAFERFGWDAKYKACSYGKPLPTRTKTSGCRIYFVDMSTTPEILSQLVAEGNEVIILDHHETAQASLNQYESLPEEHNILWDNGRDIEPGVFVRFDMKKSGAMLAWEYFHPNTEPPKMIQYIQDRDLWTKQLPDNEAIHCSLATQKFKFDDYRLFNNKLENQFEDVVADGNAILRAHEQISKQIGSSHRVIDWRGHKVAVVNCTTLWSDVCNDLLKLYQPQRDEKGNWLSWVRLDNEGNPILIDYVIGYSIQSAASRFLMSLRSTGDFSVSEIAKTFGGGGHRNASGINVSLAEGLELLKEWGLLNPI